MEQETNKEGGVFCNLLPHKPSTPHHLLFSFSTLCSLFVAFCLCFAQNTFGQDIDVLNHPVNLSGLTGLLYTTEPYTLNTGTIEVGASVVTEYSNVPEYTINNYPVSVSVGLPHNAELALRSSYYEIKEGATFTTPVQRKTDDLQLLYKWNFIPPMEDSIRPAFALIIGGSVPTENNNEINISSVKHWAMQIGLSGGTEITWREHIIGIYADAQAIGQDLTQRGLSDFYGIYNAGLLSPISKYQNLQMFAEYSLVAGKKQLTLAGGDYSALTYGLRLVSDRFNLTIGTQFLHKVHNEGFGNADRFMAMLSVKL